MDGWHKCGGETGNSWKQHRSRWQCCGGDGNKTKMEGDQFCLMLVNKMHQHMHVINIRCELAHVSAGADECQWLLQCRLTWGWIPLTVSHWGQKPDAGEHWCSLVHAVKEALMRAAVYLGSLHRSLKYQIVILEFTALQQKQGGYSGWRWICSQGVCQERGDKSPNLHTDECVVWVKVEILFMAAPNMLQKLLQHCVNLAWILTFGRILWLKHEVSLLNDWRYLFFSVLVVFSWSTQQNPPGIKLLH